MSGRTKTASGLHEMRAGKYVPKADNLNFERAWNFNEAICSSHPGATRNLIWPLYGQDLSLIHI